MRAEDPLESTMAQGRSVGSPAALLVKRLCDMTVAAVGLVLLAPLMAVIALLIKCESRGPALFCQVRVGLGGRPFTMYKFRTMVPGAEQGGLTVLSGDPRVTRLGHWLRSFSLDELPQLANVLQGEMSLVGPRPLLPKQIEKFTPFERTRLAVLPGMTNLPALKGRNSLSWDERMRWEIYYVEHWSLWLDLHILIRTLWIVPLRKGVYAASEEVQMRGNQ